MPEQSPQVMPKKLLGLKRALTCLGVATLVTITAAIAFAAGKRKGANNVKALVDSQGIASIPATTSPATSYPTLNPTEKVTISPTASPSASPTKSPTASPTDSSSGSPTVFQFSYPNNTSPILGLTDQPTSAPIDLTTSAPTIKSAPSPPGSYTPGKLTTHQAGLLLSEGLAARVIATTGEKLTYRDGQESKDKFHGQPDGAATFADLRANNLGGWIYASNSEMPDKGKGGVGALTFDKNGNLIDYQMVLEKTIMNCGGGKTPWDTWVSCEEVEFDGNIYQVDPTGARKAEMLTMGSDGGRWESFAFDVRNKGQPRFFATEDHNKGTVRRFTPANPNWDDPWSILHGEGIVDFLTLQPETDSGGKFAWTDDKEAAKNNARAIYPQTEGIDVYENQMFFVCKRIKQLFVLDLDKGTYYNHTTVSGLFDGHPDQMKRIIGDSNDILYFTEEGGEDSGVHARDSTGRFFSILEGVNYRGETTGLAFSPDAKHLYVAYQTMGILLDIWRVDGLSFNAKKLDVKYHAIGNTI